MCTMTSSSINCQHQDDCIIGIMIDCFWPRFRCKGRYLFKNINSNMRQTFSDHETSLELTRHREFFAPNRSAINTFVWRLSVHRRVVIITSGNTDGHCRTARQRNHIDDIWIHGIKVICGNFCKTQKMQRKNKCVIENKMPELWGRRGNNANRQLH